jgi:hypothetical protein
MKRHLCLWGWLCLLALPAFAQAPIGELQKLDFLLGDWQGTGWIEFGPNQRHTVRQTEKIQVKAGGAVVQIEGLGLERRDEKDVPVHQAFAIVSYDNEAKRFRLNTWRAGGGAIECEPEIGDKRLVWGFKEPRSGMQIRFTVKLDAAGRWVEVGESSRDGQNWRQFMELTLQKAGKP